MSKKKEDGTKLYNVVIDIPNLVEAEIDKDNKNVLVRVIENGWSLNNTFYSKRVVESISGLLENRKKMYVNHLLRGNSSDYLGRDMRDWSAQILESYYEDGSTYARIHIFDDPDGWLFERIEKFPDAVGVSIDARGRVKEGEMGGRTGMIVEEILKFNSVDFVNSPAAGGQALRLVAGEYDKLEDPTLIIEVLRKFGDFANRQSDKFFHLFHSFENFLWYLMGQYYNDSGDIESQSDFDKIMKKGFDDFKKEMMQIDFSKVYVFEAVKEHGEEVIEDMITETEEDGTNKERFKNKIISLYKKIGVKEEDVPTHLFESINTPGGENMDLKELQKEHPELLEQYKKDLLQELEKDGELDTIKAEKSEMEKEFNSVKEEKTKIEKELDEYKVKETVQAKKDKISDMLKESKLEDEHITSVFKETLMGLKKDEDISKHIKDREELVFGDTGKVKNVGDPQPKGDPKDKQTVKEIKDEDAINLIK